MADDFGRVVDSEKQIEAFIWPYEKRTADLRESLAKLSRMGRIVRGKAANVLMVSEIVNWSKHQKVDHPNAKAALPQVVEASRLPDLRESLAKDSEAFANNSMALAPDQDHDLDHDQRSKGTARKKRAPAAYPEWVEQAWEIWDGAVGKVTRDRIRRVLASLVDKHGWPRVRDALKVYIDPDEGPALGKSRRLEWFAEDFHTWRIIAETPMDDGQGVLTDRGRRLMARGAA
jgi:hypothetical protein